MNADPMQPDDPIVEKYTRELLDLVRPLVVAVRGDEIVVKPIFLSLVPEYSTSLPTGIADGKIWKARHGDAWMLCEYVDEGDLRHVSIHRRRIEVIS